MMIDDTEMKAQIIHNLQNGAILRTTSINKPGPGQPTEVEVTYIIPGKRVKLARQYRDEPISKKKTVVDDILDLFEK